ncbi:MAG: hypothetical protein MUP98_14595 [Candidatus Aminicenantes bacterium]|nr:hypothetical protein [Candidatus Aminicenantes bacterium]
MKKVIIPFCLILFICFTQLDAQDCITSDCHVDFSKLNVLHTPVKNDCTLCHIQTGQHQFRFERKEDLCVSCHSDRNDGRNQHRAMEKFKCEDCHTWHGGSDRLMLKTERIDAMCFQCHDQEPMAGTVVHGPMATGNCAICHDAHSSNNVSLLKSPKETLCVRCHIDKDYSGGEMHIHSPLKDGCEGCHDSHSSDHPFQLLAPAQDICQRCHEELMQNAGQVRFKHAIIEEGKKCANCHDPHGSVFEHNLLRDPLNLCLGCHDKPIIGTDGKDYNIARIVSRNPRKHGPVADGSCAGCHNPHGSNYYKILIQNFPEMFYTAFQEEKYNLCFQCHEFSLVRDERTQTLTNFRDGDRNLHYLHVNRDKGRTCRACHEIHAGDLPNHIRHETPFGEWGLPIGFQKLDNGGTCVSGCHKAFTYIRNK